MNQRVWAPHDQDPNPNLIKNGLEWEADPPSASWWVSQLVSQHCRRCMYSTRQVGLMLWLNSPSASYWSQWACMLLTAVDYVVAFRNKPQWWRNHRWHQAVSERGGSEDHRCARCSWAVIQAAFFSFFNSCALTAPLPLTDSNMKNFKIQVEQSTENTLHLTPCPKYWMFRPTEALENKIL